MTPAPPEAFAGAPADEDARAACQQVVAEAAQVGQLPSLRAATFHRGEVGWEAALGDAGHQYRIGSITKTFTAVAVLQQRDQGLLALDDPIGAHVPDAPFAERTIGSLLAHSSGMTAEPAGAWWERVAGGDWEALAADNGAAAQVFRPGRRHHYSNLGYGLLGELLSRRAGMPWWDVVEQRLVTPLGLTQTSYLPRDGAAVGTSRDPRDGRLFREPAHDAGAMAPAGQLWSTVDDLARWAEFLAVGREDVLDASTLDEMRTACAADPLTQHRGAYGLGFRLRWRSGSTLVGHTGSMPGFLAGCLVDPTTRVGAVVLTNATRGIDVEQVVSDLIDAAEPWHVASVASRPAGPERPVAADIVELGGDWYWGNTTMSLAPDAEGLTLTSDGLERGFAWLGTDRFRGTSGYFAGEELRVVRRPDGAPAYLEVATFVLTRKPYDPSAPIAGGPPTPL